MTATSTAFSRAVKLIGDEHEAAEHHQQRAVALNPNNDLIVVQQGELYTWMGEPEKGIEWIRKAMRLNPSHPQRYWSHLGRAFFVARRYGEAIESFRRISHPDRSHHAFLAACFADDGRRDSRRVACPLRPYARSGLFHRYLFAYPALSA